MELLGKEYILDHITNEIGKQREMQAYQCYMAECLRLLTENVAAICRGKYIDAHWYDIIEKGEAKSEDDQKTGDEIAADIINRMGLAFGGE